MEAESQSGHTPPCAVSRHCAEFSNEFSNWKIHPSVPLCPRAGPGGDVDHRSGSHLTNSFMLPVASKDAFTQPECVLNADEPTFLSEFMYCRRLCIDAQTKSHARCRSGDPLPQERTALTRRARSLFGPCCAASRHEGAADGVCSTSIPPCLGSFRPKLWPNGTARWRARAGAPLSEPRSPLRAGRRAGRLHGR